MQNTCKNIQILTKTTTHRLPVRAKKSTQEAQLSTPANTGIQSENKRGRTQQTKISRTTQHRIEVMKLKTKNRKLTQNNKKENTPAELLHQSKMKRQPVSPCCLV